MNVGYLMCTIIFTAKQSEEMHALKGRKFTAFNSAYTNRLTP